MTSTNPPAQSTGGFDLGALLSRLGTVIGLGTFFAPWLFVRGCRSAGEFNALDMAQEGAMGGFVLTLLIAAPGVIGLAILFFVGTKRRVLRERLARLKMVLAAIAALPSLETILTVLYTPGVQDVMELRWGAWANLVGYGLAGVGGFLTVLTTGPPGRSLTSKAEPDRAPVAKVSHILSSLWAGLVALLIFIGNLSQAGNAQSPLNRYLNYEFGTWFLLGTTMTAMLVGVVFLSFFVKRGKEQRSPTYMPSASASSVVCPACGEKTPAGEFCGWCGARLSVPEQVGSPSGQAPAQLNSSRASPTRQTIVCASCGRNLPASSTFCGWCGAPIKRIESPPAAEPEAATSRPRQVPVKENDLLRQAAAAVRADRRAEARQILEQILQANPGHEQAWAWMSTAARTDAERVECLQRVLAINPDNANARKMLAQFQERMRATSAPTPSAASSGAAQCPRCRASNRTGAKFCRECGHRMA